VSQAADARDTLAKSLYDRLFGWLVTQINNSIRGTFTEDSPFIGILDIFGFENFTVSLSRSHTSLAL
jgi:myosin heavy subunit